MERAARRFFILINLAHLLTHYSLLILPTAVLAMVGAGSPFGASYGPVLELATGMFVLYGLFSLPQGWLAQRLGRKTLIGVFFFGLGAALIGAGLAGRPFTLALALSAAGLFAAIYHPIGTAMLVDAAGDRPGRAVGVNGVFGNLGVALAPIVTGLLAGHFGWRAGFVVPGAVALALGAVWVRSRAVAQHAGFGSKRPFPAIPPALVRRAVVVLLLIAAVSGLVFNAFTILLPKLLADRLGGSLLPLVGASAFIATLAGAVTQFSVGRLIDRLTLKRVFLPLSVVLVPSLAALGFVQGLATVVVAGLVACAVFGQVTVNETMTARYIAPPLRARMYSVRFFVSFLGSAAAPFVVGQLYERTGSLTAVTLILALFGLITLACAVFFPDRREELAPELWEMALAAE